MNLKPIFLFLSIMLLFSCDEIIDEDGATSCIREKIDKIKEEPVANPPRAVYSYQYKGKTVQYFASNCCDFYNEVYDVICNLVCAPDGGIAGTGDGRCTDFFSVATHRTLIWKDPRK